MAWKPLAIFKSPSKGTLQLKLCIKLALQQSIVPYTTWHYTVAKVDDALRMYWLIYIYTIYIYNNIGHVLSWPFCGQCFWLSKPQSSTCSTQARWVKHQKPPQWTTEGFQSLHGANDPSLAATEGSKHSHAIPSMYGYVWHISLHLVDFYGSICGSYGSDTHPCLVIFLELQLEVVVEGITTYTQHWHSTKYNMIRQSYAHSYTRKQTFSFWIHITLHVFEDPLEASW